LPIAEKLSVVEDIDRIVLKKAMLALSELDAFGQPIPKVSFNVVANYLEDPQLPKRCRDNYSGETKICFEVLESVLIEDQSDLFRHQIDLLKDMGFGIEVDDFGSGHASIIGLMHLNPDAMKIDQRLVMPISESENAKRLVQSIVDIGKSLGIKITAEGVETLEHAQILQSMGCDTLQGYYFAKPMPCDHLKIFLREWRAKPKANAPHAV
jgi:EAL domain-containing protein (putative c-di-GMP-specific phosphodiesterase class I)